MSQENVEAYKRAVEAEELTEVLRRWRAASPLSEGHYGLHSHMSTLSWGLRVRALPSAALLFLAYPAWISGFSPDESAGQAERGHFAWNVMTGCR